MPNKHTLTRAYKSEGGSVNISEKDILVGLSENIEEVIPLGAADLQVIFAINVADMKSFGLSCKKPSPSPGPGDIGLTVKTNSSGSPTDTFKLTSTSGILWMDGDPTANPVTANITTLYVTNTGDTDCELILRAGSDPTP